MTSFLPSSVLRLGLAFLMAASGWASADSLPVARVDFLLRDDISVEILNVSEGGQAEEAAWGDSRTIVSKFPVTTTWESHSITLHPVTDGRVTVLLMGNDSKARPPVFIRYDAVSSSNDALGNGGFEKVDKHGVPVNWVSVNTPDLEQENKATVDSGKAFEGTKSIRVWHNSRYVQTLQLTAGEDVTFTFQCRIE